MNILMKCRRSLGALAALTLALFTVPVEAALPRRVNVVQHGDFLLIGNTVGRDCANGVPLPVVGTVGDCGLNKTDTGIDVFWSSDNPQAGQASASTAVTLGQARSTATLSIPANAQVTFARLYWAAVSPGTSADDTVTLDAPGATSATLQADATFTFVSSGITFYQSTRDITDVVVASGAGPYAVSGIASPDVVDLDSFNVYAGWSMVVFYEDDALPLRQLALYHGLDRVYSAGWSTTTLSGFLTPAGSVTAKLGVVAYDGDSTNASDSLRFEGTSLSDAQNPATNFFNGTRSYLGSAVSVTGDLPQLTGEPRSMSGIDIDVVDMAPLLGAGKTSATLEARSSAERYFLGYFVTAIDTLPVSTEPDGGDDASTDGSSTDDAGDTSATPNDGPPGVDATPLEAAGSGDAESSEASGDASLPPSDATSDSSPDASSADASVDDAAENTAREGGGGGGRDGRADGGMATDAQIAADHMLEAGGDQAFGGTASEAVDDGGCSCSTMRSRHRPDTFSLFVAAALGLRLRRRARKLREDHPSFVAW